ncbi:hypothetical protein CHOED_035 [Vibrio phage CHOED]|uniref:hypothetical protein n=1 Tax=Vibrio phage CHOED TaxID=1458716 RepID=UPI00042E3F75|nr:hypothetical protein CHOED_035 [Vibrio phage CHOED]AHK11895.1 hypothetical protein CHOED_035 [Vibrio phage CHOED]
MNIGLDFDNTITADPELFHMFIVNSRLRGHDIRIVTCRSEEYGLDEVYEYASKFTPELPVIHTAGYEKHDYCIKYHDFPVDVWVDDNPHWVGTRDKDEWHVKPVE